VHEQHLLLVRRRLRQLVLPVGPDLLKRHLLYGDVASGRWLLPAGDGRLRLVGLLPDGPVVCRGDLLYGDPLRDDLLQQRHGLWAG